MIDDAKVKQLIDRCHREVDAGLLPSCQVALAHGGEVVVDVTIGDATPDTRYCFFSATKPLVAATVWQLLAEGAFGVEDRVADHIPEFGTEGKDVITVEQVMLHTSGFPHAPLGAPQWETRDGRLQAFSRWRLNWEPGTRYEYHPTSAHWVLAELIERATDKDYRDAIHERLTAPLGLPRLLGIDATADGDVAELVLTGEHATADELEAAYGVREMPVTEVTDDALMAFNDKAVRVVGVPGGGGFGRASDLALFYQGLLHDHAGLWPAELLADVTGTVRNRLPDPMGTPANRTLGLVQAGDDGFSNVRGLGRTVSPEAFGHPGAGGQLAWADPESGLSLGYVTNGVDRHEVRQPRRDTAISSMAAVCAA